jgi:hypothetical protein
MDESNVGAKPDPKDLEPRPPAEADLVALCREHWFAERGEEPPRAS